MGAFRCGSSMDKNDSKHGKPGDERKSATNVKNGKSTRGSGTTNQASEAGLRDPVRDLHLEHTMSVEEVKEYRDAFSIFDTNGDGTITTKEVVTVLRSLGQDPSQETAQRMINAFDDNGDGKIEFKEFLLLVDRLVENTETDEELAEIFNVIDIDGDGEISKTDLRTTANRLGSAFGMRELSEMINEFDKDGNGLIDFEEFKKIINTRM